MKVTRRKNFCICFYILAKTQILLKCIHLNFVITNSEKQTQKIQTKTEFL